MPPAAPAMKNVFEGLGMPATLETRPPMLAGPTLRQRKPASNVESSGVVTCEARGGGGGERGGGGGPKPAHGAGAGRPPGKKERGKGAGNRLRGPGAGGWGRGRR